MEDQNNGDKKLENVKVGYGHYENGKKIIMQVSIIVLICIVVAIITIFVYEKFYIQGKIANNLSEQISNQENNEIINQGNNSITQSNDEKVLSANTQSNDENVINANTNNQVSNIKPKTNQEIITSYGYTQNDFINFVIDSMKMYSSMNILFNATDGDVTASRSLPEQITNNQQYYKNKISELINNTKIVTNIYTEGTVLKCNYDESELLNQLGVSSHMGYGLISSRTLERDGIATYTFPNRIVDVNIPSTQFFVSDYTETELTTNYYSNNQTANHEVTIATLYSDKLNVQNDFTIQMAKIMAENNNENLKLIGTVVTLNVDNNLYEVGYNLKNVVAIGKDTGNIYTFNTIEFSKTHYKDNNLVWVVDNTGTVSCYILMQGATSINPIAENIEIPSVG